MPFAKIASWRKCNCGEISQEHDSVAVHVLPARNYAFPCNCNKEQSKTGLKKLPGCIISLYSVNTPRHTVETNGSRGHIFSAVPKKEARGGRASMDQPLAHSFEQKGTESRIPVWS